MANALTILRIVLSLAMLVSAALSPGFFVLYALAGISDMVDVFGTLSLRFAMTYVLRAK